MGCVHNSLFAAHLYSRPKAKMAIVKGLSMEALRSLGKSITFKTLNGRIVAGIHQPKRTGPRSKAEIVTSNRFKVACYYLKTLSAELIALWESYVVETDWTWKDAFISSFLKSWAENNTPPIVVSDLKFSWEGPTARLDFKIADWYYGLDYGYGTDGYGCCPYGTPTDLTVDQPRELIPSYKFGYRPPTPRPYN